jgi:3-hydroxybutyryl-CoA dehydratase
MTISQPQLGAYAQASGDHNPLHLDAGFAAATQFQGIIAHGMLALACISQMMEVHLGRAWLESGALSVRFKGAAYAGDELESFGRVSRSSKIDGGPAVTCNVGVRNLGSGQDLITGSAKAKLAEAT